MSFWNRQDLCLKMIANVGIRTSYQKSIRVDLKISKFMVLSPEYKSKHVAITVICSVQRRCSDDYKPCFHFKMIHNHALSNWVWQRKRETHKSLWKYTIHIVYYVYNILSYIYAHLLVLPPYLVSIFQTHRLSAWMQSGYNEFYTTVAL